MSLLVSGYTSYSNNDKTIASRISVVETKQSNSDDRLDRMETKLDQILQEVYSNRETNQQKLEDVIRAIQSSKPPPYRVPARQVPPPLPPTLPLDPPALNK